MKTIATLIIIVFCFANPASAFEFNKLTANDRKLMTLASFAMIDYQQSVKMFYKSDGIHEINPVLGRTPTREDMMAFGLTGMTLAYGINRYMPEGGFKKFLFDSIIATERLNIEENQKLIRTGKRTFGCIMLVMSFNY